MPRRLTLLLVLACGLFPAGSASAQSTPVGESKHQQVAVAPDGRAVFTWLRWDGSNWIAQARARAADGRLSGVQNLSGRERDAARPQVAIDDQGDAVFMWARSNGTNRIAQTRARSAAGTLSAVQNLSSPWETADEPRVDVDADGDAVFSWQSDDGNYYIAKAKARARAADGTLSPTLTLSSAGADAHWPGVAVDADGDAVFVWHRAGIIQSKRLASDGTLSSVQNVAGPGATGPNVGVDDAGNAIFSWTRGYPSGQFTRRRDVAGSLSAPQFVSASSGEVYGYPTARMVVGGDGDAVFVWESVTYDGPQVLRAIKARRRAADGTMSAVASIAAAGIAPRVALDAGGDAVITWFGWDGDAPVGRARRRAQDGTLSPTQNLVLISPNSPTEVGVDDAGNAVFAWMRSNGTRHVIQGRHRAEGGALSPLFTLSD